MVIRVEHAARGKTFDYAQFLNPEQDECGPDIIEELNSNEQNPKRYSVFIAPSRKRDTIMADEHFPKKQLRNAGTQEAWKRFPAFLRSLEILRPCVDLE